MDAAGFAKFLTPEGAFKWGSNPTVHGTQAVTDFCVGFFGMLKSVTHNVFKTWSVSEKDEILFVQGEAVYMLPNGTETVLPFLNKFRMKGQLIDEYLVYADPTPLFRAME